MPTFAELATQRKSKEEQTTRESFHSSEIDRLGLGSACREKERDSSCPRGQKYPRLNLAASTLCNCLSC
jgi:hypothetical protein